MRTAYCVEEYTMPLTKADKREIGEEFIEYLTTEDLTRTWHREDLEQYYNIFSEGRITMTFSQALFALAHFGKPELVVRNGNTVVFRRMKAFWSRHKIPEAHRVTSDYIDIVAISERTSETSLGHFTRVLSDASTEFSWMELELWNESNHVIQLIDCRVASRPENFSVEWTKIDYCNNYTILVRAKCEGEVRITKIEITLLIDGYYKEKFTPYIRFEVYDDEDNDSYEDDVSLNSSVDYEISHRFRIINTSSCQQMLADVPIRGKNHLRKAPWTVTPPIIDTSLHNSLPSFSPFITKSTYYADLINTRYPEALLIFTDGSKSPSGSGYSVYIPRYNVRLSQPCSNLSSILTVELQAIQLALLWLLQRKGRNVAILSDSLSAIMSIKKFQEALNDIVNNIIELDNLLSRDSTIAYIWIPGHSAIHGNTVADQLAKEAAACPFVESRGHRDGIGGVSSVITRYYRYR